MSQLDLRYNDNMTPAVSFGSDEFLSLPRRKQNELIYSLLAPLARMDFARELEWLANKKEEVKERVQRLEKMLEADSIKIGGENSYIPIPVVPTNYAAPPSPKNNPKLEKSKANGPILGNSIPSHPRSRAGSVPYSVQSTFHETQFNRLSSSTASSCMSVEAGEEFEAGLAIAQFRKSNPKVVLNVGGEKHEVMWRLLEKQPRSRLGLLAAASTPNHILELCDAYSLEENEYYFDRHPRTFNCILNFYRTGKLHLMEELCVMDFCQDLDYWMIDDVYLEPCCEGKYTGRKEHVMEEIKKHTKVSKKATEEEYFGDGPCARYQKCLWDLMEKPNSSLFAKCLSLFSISLVLISTVGMCLNTMPEFKSKNVLDSNGDPADNPYFALIEAFCISWFTIEYFLRLAGAPNKLQFLKGPLNIIDVLAILPYYLSLVIIEEPMVVTGPTTLNPLGSNVTINVQATTEQQQVDNNQMEFDDWSRIIQVFRIARIMRIFKLARSSSGLQAIAHTMKSSYKELSLLLLFVGMGMLIFGSLAYFVEKDNEDTKYTSIPESMWWAIQTMTSVGYGDLCPLTTLGKLVGSCCGVSGVLVMALPIPIVVENFGAYYMEQKKKDVIAKKKSYNDKMKQEEILSKRMERDNLVRILHSKPGPFTSVPASPEIEFRRPSRMNGTGAVANS